MNRLREKVLWAIALMLFVTAVLKVVQFVRVPLSAIITDPGITLLTNREALILGAVMEILVALSLIKSIQSGGSGQIILYFCTCASLYHLSLFTQSDQQHCSCLGVATDLLGARASTWLIRLMLSFLWVAGIFIFNEERKEVRLRQRDQHSPQVMACLLIIAWISTSPIRATADQVLISGELRSTYDYNGKTSEDTKAFQARFDDDTLLISYLPPALPSRYNSGTASNIFFVNKGTNAVVTFNMQENLAVASFRREDIAWQLGNCGDGLASRVFTMVRCLALFPSESASKVRAFSVASTVAGEPLSVISEAHYTYAGTGSEQTLSCDIRVSDVLRKKWRSSAFLGPEWSNGENTNYREAQALVARYHEGFLLEKIQLSHFINVAGMRIPTLAEFSKFAPPRTNTTGKSVREIPYGNARLDLRVINYAEGSVTFPQLDLPNQVTITEERLFDQALQISGVRYTTNALTSLSISPLARLEFSHQVELMAKRRFRTRISSMLGWIMVFVVIAGPLIMWKTSQRSNISK